MNMTTLLGELGNYERIANDRSLSMDMRYEVCHKAISLCGKHLNPEKEYYWNTLARKLCIAVWYMGCLYTFKLTPAE